MKSRGRLSLVGLALSCVVAAPAVAGIAPYVRVDFGGSQFRMTDGNSRIRETETAFKTAGYTVDFHEVGTGYGSGAAAGLWLLPGFRVGATYSLLKSSLENYVHVPGDVFFADELQFRMSEIGAEAAVRIRSLAGLTLGANVARGRAELVEAYTVEDYYASSFYYQDGTGNRTVTTYGGYVGLDQTNPAGVVGFIRAGFQYRDVGRMPFHMVVSDGVTSSPVDGETIWLDYSGFYVKAGVGFDLVR